LYQVQSYENTVTKLSINNTKYAENIADVGLYGSLGSILLLLDWKTVYKK